MTAANALLLTLYKNAWKGGREVTGRSIHDVFPLNWVRNKIE
jgi:hypothetical protein